MHPDSKLCYCFHISQRKIVNWVKREQPRRASQISECFGAGTGCGWCVPFLVKIHQQLVLGQEVDDEELSAEAYEALRSEYITQVERGERARNRHAARAEYGHLEDPASPPRAPRDADNYDVSDYFSRRASTDPEPEDLI